MKEDIQPLVQYEGNIDAPETALSSSLAGSARYPRRTVSELIQASGVRTTRRRAALAGLLFGKGDQHITVEMLYSEAIKANISVSLATVYNTVNQLADLGALRRVSIDGAKTYYDTNVNNHHHFYFEGSHDLVDIPNSEMGVEAMPEIPEGYEVARIDIVVRLRQKTQR
jgi:Fur family transcriptional regulator, iron response regulator